MIGVDMETWGYYIERGSRDGMNADSCHAKYNDKDKTIV